VPNFTTWKVLTYRQDDHHDSSCDIEVCPDNLENVEEGIIPFIYRFVPITFRGLDAEVLENKVLKTVPHLIHNLANCIVVINRAEWGFDIFDVGDVDLIVEQGEDVFFLEPGGKHIYTLLYVLDQFSSVVVVLAKIPIIIYWIPIPEQLVVLADDIPDNQRCGAETEVSQAIKEAE